MHVYNVGHFGLKIIARYKKSRVNTDEVLEYHIITSLDSNFKVYQ